MKKAAVLFILICIVFASCSTFKNGCGFEDRPVMKAKYKNR